MQQQYIRIQERKQQTNKHTHTQTYKQTSKHGKTMSISVLWDHTEIEEGTLKKAFGRSGISDESVRQQWEAWVQPHILSHFCTSNDRNIVFAWMYTVHLPTLTHLFGWLECIDPSPLVGG